MSEFFLYDEDLSDNESTFSDGDKNIEIVNKSNSKITMAEDIGNIKNTKNTIVSTISNNINNYSSKQTITNNNK